MISGPKKTVSIVMSAQLYEKLNELAEESSRSMSAYIRQVLKAHLEYLGRFRGP